MIQIDCLPAQFVPEMHFDDNGRHWRIKVIEWRWGGWHTETRPERYITKDDASRQCRVWRDELRDLLPGILNEENMGRVVAASQCRLSPALYNWV